MASPNRRHRIFGGLRLRDRNRAAGRAPVHLWRFAALLAGVVLAGILASTMSPRFPASGGGLQRISESDERVLPDKDGREEKVAAARLTVVVIALIAMFLARDPNSSVFGIVSFAWAGFGAAFGPVVLFGLFWKRANWQGALAGMVSGGVTIFVWKYLIRPFGGAWNIYELFAGVSGGLRVHHRRQPCHGGAEKEIVDTFNAVKAL